MEILQPRIENLAAALNAHLPRTIRIMECTAVPPDFHARFSAKGKIYIYRIYNGPFQTPLELGRSWHIPTPLDIPMLSHCAQKLTGTHDFAGFAANRGKPEESTVRTIYRIDVEESGPIVTMTFEGTGFLYKMVRLLTGSMVRCAQNKAKPEWLDELLGGKTKSSFAAVAHGLYLNRVLY